MPLPILGWVAVAAATATVAYLASDDDSSSSSSDRDDREREAKEKAREEKKKKIRKKINNYEKEEILKIKEKYDTSIEFKSTKVKIISKDKRIQNKVTDLKKESRELTESLAELEAMRNETHK